MSYSVVILAALGISVVSRWIVTDQHDLNLLKNIAKRAGVTRGKFSATVSKFLDRRHDVRAKRPEKPRYRTIEDMIDVADDNVYNLLVDQSAIERVAIFDNDQECARYTWTGSSQKAVPVRNVARTWSQATCTQFRVIRSAQDKDPVPDAQRRKYERNNPFSKDTKAQVRAANESIAQEKASMDSLRAKRKEITQRKKSLDREESEYNAEAERWQTQYNSIHSQISQYKESLAEHSQAELQRVMLHVLEVQEDQLNELERAIDKETKKRDALKASLDEALARSKPLEKEFETAKMALENVGNDISEFEETVKDMKDNQLEPVLLKKAKAESKLKKLREAVQETESKIQNAAQMYEKVRKQALTLTDDQEVEPTATQARLRKMMEKVDKAIQKEQKKQACLKEDVDVVIERAKAIARNAKRRYEDQCNMIVKVRRRCLELKRSLKQRRKKWKRFRTHMQKTTNHWFDVYLSQKNQGGSVLFDDKAQTLEMNWVKERAALQADSQEMQLTQDIDEEDDDREYKDMKSLSGGERSYATMALLLSLGKVVQCPFRVMDEFDVFMDESTRKEAMQQLMEAAQGGDRTTNQFIFITPHDIRNISSGPDVHKFNMRPPEKDFGRAEQQTLDFRAAP